MRGACIGILAAILVLDSASRTPAFGQVSAKDTQIIARTMTFLDPAPSGIADIGIVYAPAEPDSITRAQRVASVFGAGVTVGRLTVRPRLVAVDRLSDVQGLAAMFVTAGLSDGGLARVAAAARRLRVPSISTDMVCVQQAVCTVGVDSDTSVRIVISHAACQAAGISFIQAFRILVIEQ